MSPREARMRRTWLAALVVVVLFLFDGAPAARADFAGDFAPLRAELERRRDEDLVGTLDKTGRKQLKAVLGAIALLDKGGNGLSAEMKTAGKLIKRLAKAYPAEFDPATKSLAADLADVMTALLEALQASVAEALSLAEDMVASLPPAQRDRARRALDRAREILAGAHPSDLREWQRLLAQAYCAAVHAQGLVARRVGTLYLSIDGGPPVAATSLVTYLTPQDYFEIDASFQAPAAGYAVPEGDPLVIAGPFRLWLAADPFTRREGTQPLGYTAISLSAAATDTYRADGGEIEVVDYRSSRRRVSGTFTFDATNYNPGGDTTSHTVTGVFTVFHP